MRRITGVIGIAALLNTWVPKTLALDLFKEFATSIGASHIDIGRLRAAALIRLVVIFPTLFAFTFASMISMFGRGQHQQAQTAVISIWVFMALVYVSCNLYLYYFSYSRARLARVLTYISIFAELGTNQLVLYLTGSLTSHSTLFIVLLVCVYRVFLDYRFSLFSALCGGALYATTAAIELSGIVPVSPGIPASLAHQVYTGIEGFPALRVVQAVLMGIAIAFFSVNYGMNQVQKLQRQLEIQSSLDGLTGISNRATLDEYMDVEWRRARRIESPLSVIMIDIDAFKAYNDLYGHPAGDECLKQIAQSLRQAAKRPADMVARYGGEEFIIVLPDTDEKGAAELARALRSYVEGLGLPHAGSPVHDRVTISLGVAGEVPGPCSSAMEVIDRADRALYAAKQNGRNRVELASAENTLQA